MTVNVEPSGRAALRQFVEPGEIQRSEDYRLDLACFIQDRVPEAQRRLAAEWVRWYAPMAKSRVCSAR